jgi:hypothetical protein
VTAPEKSPDWLFIEIKGLAIAKVVTISNVRAGGDGNRDQTLNPGLSLIYRALATS